MTDKLHREAVWAESKIRHLKWKKQHIDAEIEAAEKDYHLKRNAFQDHMDHLFKGSLDFSSHI